MITVERNSVLSLLRENERLTERVDELLAEATRRVEESLPRRVRAFHTRFSHPVRHTPAFPTEGEIQHRMGLLHEEVSELVEAMRNRDMPAVADALADIEYVIEGARAILGIDGAPVMRAVHAANMSKGPNDERGKPTKLPGWSPPDVAGILRSQGWEPGNHG